MVSDPNPQANANIFTHEEIVAIKSLVSKPPNPWWRDYPFLVSLCAFLLALSTSVISAYASYLRDIHDQQTQLSAAVANLQRLNIETIEVNQKYHGTPFENMASGFINNEINSTIHSAEQIALYLKDRASTSDLVAIANGSWGLGELELTEKLLKYALASSVTANDEGVALRELGTFSIQAKKTVDALKEGNDYFQRALAVDRKYGIEQPANVAWLRSQAYLTWAYSLVYVGDCVGAKALFMDGVRILKGAPDNLDIQREKDKARSQWQIGIGGNPACMPDNDTQPLN